MRSPARRLLSVGSLVSFAVALTVAFAGNPFGAASFLGGARGMAFAEGQTGVAPTDEPSVAATRGLGREPWIVVYDPPSRRIAFEHRGLPTKGIVRRGVRIVSWDLSVEELNPRLAESGQVPVSRVRAAVEKERLPGVAGPSQPPGGRVALVAIQGQSQEPWAFIFDATSDRLAAYRGGQLGVELKGVRWIAWDVLLEELNPRRTAPSRVTVAAVRQAVQEQGKRPEVEGTPERPREVLLAAARGTSGEPWAILYDVATGRLAVYRAENQGLKLEGLRDTRWDLRLEGVDPRIFTQRPTVATVRALVEEISRTQAPPKEGEPKESADGGEGGGAPEGTRKPAPIRLAVTQETADEPAIFLFDDASKRVVIYRVAPQGLELRGARSIGGELKEEELGPEQ